MNSKNSFWEQRMVRLQNFKEKARLKLERMHADKEDGEREKNQPKEDK